MRNRFPSLWTALRFAARTLLQRPGFTAVAALTLALGIGASTAVFSIVEAVLLRPLPYADPDRLAAVWLTSTREAGLAKIFATHRDFLAFRSQALSLESVAAATWAGRNSRVLTGVGPAREVLIIPASASFFETLGVGAALGRTFRPSDEMHGCSIVLAHSFWTSVLQSDTTIAGKPLTLDRHVCTVLGVMPPGFSFYPRQTQAWVLLGPAYQPEQDQMLTGIFARLKRGVPVAQAQAEIRNLYRALRPGQEAKDLQPIVLDLHGEFTFLAGRTLRTTLLLVFSAVLLVLLIACLNIANLLLAQLSDRRRELAIRAALGSGRGRLIGQVLTEGLLVASLGGVLGIAIAYSAVGYFRYANPIELSVGAGLVVSLPVLLFSAVLTFATTALFALLPALRASRIDLAQSLKAGSSSNLGRQNLSRFVIAVEMAFSFVLLIGAGIFLSSAVRMRSEPLGYEPEGVLTTRVSASTQTQQSLLSRLENNTMFAAVALASKVPPDAGGNQVLEVQGRPSTEAHEVGADIITSRFFEALKIPVLRGRPFTAQDRDSSLPVVIVNQSLAERYFGASDPLGWQIRLAGGGMPWLTVVGVVGNLKHTQLMNEMAWVETPILYRPLSQEARPSISVVARANVDLGSAARELQRQIAIADPSTPINDTEQLTARLAQTLAYPRFRAILLGFFALTALLLSAAGLHGVLRQLVSRRGPELGLRRALGAQTRDLYLLIAREAGLPVLFGLGAGMILTAALSGLSAKLLYGIEAIDPIVIASVSIVLLMAALLAIVAPACRAARIDPLSSLRRD